MRPILYFLVVTVIWLALPIELLWLGWAMKTFLAAYPIWMALIVTAAHLTVLLGLSALHDSRRTPPKA